MGRSGVLAWYCKTAEDVEGCSTLEDKGKLYVWTSCFANRRASSAFVPDIGRLRALRKRTSSECVRRWYALRTCSVGETSY